jgi:hypothetical protein
MKIKGNIRGMLGNVVVDCTIEADYFVDNHYGADADGNRGIRAEFYEYDHVTEATYVLTDEPVEKEKLDDIKYELDNVEWDGMDEDDYEGDEEDKEN